MSPVGTTEDRAKVVAEAQTWLGTPFHHGARIKGIGADCETFIECVFRACGVFNAEIPAIPSQWWLNGREELYLNYLTKYATEYALAGDRRPATGDCIVVRRGRVFAHGAIVLDWPRVIHCFPPAVRISDIRTNPVFAGRPMKFFDPWRVPSTQSSVLSQAELGTDN
jgi:cell wall-associated NlpC family hydrolase